MAMSRSLGATSFISLPPMYSSPPVMSSRPGDHPQGGGLAAAGGAHQHDELLVRNVQVEVLHRHNALIGDLKIGLLLGLALLGLFLLFGVGIHLLEVFQNDLCHNAQTVTVLPPQGTASRPAKPQRLTAGLHTAAPPVSAGPCSSFVFPAGGQKVEWPPPVGIGYVYFTTSCRPLATAFGQNFPHFAAFIGKLRKKRRHRPFFFLL